MKVVDATTTITEELQHGVHLNIKMTAPELPSYDLHSIAPAAQICCGDVLAEYTKRKKETGKPDSGNELNQCIQDMTSKLASTPCGKIQEEYANCRATTGTRFQNTVCYKYMAALAECAAKHIGKLD